MTLAAVAACAILLAVPIFASATPVNTLLGADKGARRLLSLERADGSFPWLVGDPGTYQNVQGITAIGLLDAYKLTHSSADLAGAAATQRWLAAYHAANPTQLLSSPNSFFLAEYAVLTGSVTDMTLAREILDARVAAAGNGTNVILNVIQARSSYAGTLGLWDSAFYIRAASDVGNTTLAAEMARALSSQTIVSPFDSTQSYYELGLTGLMAGLAEQDIVGNKALIDRATAALEAQQNATGGFPSTYLGVAYPDDIQTTAYAVSALVAVGHTKQGLDGANYLAAAQRADGSFPPSLPDDTTEYAEVDSEATSALSDATLLVPNGVTSYADAAFGLR